MAALAAVRGALEAAAQTALQTGVGVVLLWPHPPARFSTFALPDWAAVSGRDYHPWDRDRLIIDTAGVSMTACIDRVLAELQTG